MKPIILSEVFNNAVINFHPTHESLQSIKQWLWNESQQYNSGFYCNWGLIIEKFNSGELVSLELDSFPIGFITWTKRYGPLLYIEIVEIAPEFRKKGYGKEFIFQAISHLGKIKQCDLVYLECNPEESKGFWLKQDFQELPPSNDLDRFGHLNYLWKPIKPFLKPISLPYENDGNWIQLWNCEPNKVLDHPPMWCWKIQFLENTRILRLPIIHPCSPDWNIRLILDGNEVYNGKVKRWKEEIDFDCFIVIKIIQV